MQNSVPCADGLSDLSISSVAAENPSLTFSSHSLPGFLPPSEFALGCRALTQIDMAGEDCELEEILQILEHSRQSWRARVTTGRWDPAEAEDKLSSAP
uniref:Bm12741 n=1 Tax=Brugia malayi TaxID=6279 RepID=A0A1I9GBR5_BRUMA|nr:Bm12741 [Brugia malayi]